MEKNLNDMTANEFNQYWLNKSKDEFKDDYCLSKILSETQEIIDKKQYPRLYCYLLEFDRLMKGGAYREKLDVDYNIPFWEWGNIDGEK